MPVKIQPTSVLKTNLGIQPNGPVQAKFTNLCYKKMDKFVPKDEGNLRKIVDIQPNYITYESPYASYQYYGIREDGTHKIQKWTTEGTGPYWDKRMWSVEKESIIRQLQNYIKRGV